jgi:hypothetical protein
MAVFGLVAIGLTNEAGYQHYAQSHAKDYAQYADLKANESCQSVPASQFGQCDLQALAQAEQDKRIYEYDQADLVAQRKSALWTGLTGVAALFGMVLSIVGVVLIYVTFLATREGNKISKRTGEAQTRAYISVIEATALLSEDNVPHFAFVIKNAGSSPALEMKLTITMALRRTPLEGGQIEEFERTTELSGVYSVAAADTLETPSRGVDPPPSGFFETKYLGISVGLRCEWTDVFGERHTDNGLFDILVTRWRAGDHFKLQTYHKLTADLENERLRRQARGEWEKK